MVLDSKAFEQFTTHMDRYAALWDLMLEFIDYHPDAILLLDTTLSVVKGNNTAASLLNTTPDEMAGRLLTDLIPNVESSGHLAKYREVYETGQALVIDGFCDPENYGDKKFILRVLKINGGIAIVGTNVTDIKATHRRRRYARNTLPD